MYNGKKVSVVLATYREKKSIRKVVEDYWKTGFVDEIVVVNNNAEEGTDEELRGTKARIVYEKMQGYGYAYQKAILEAKGDYVIVTEADGSLIASDAEKFLIFAKEYEVVLGSRTSLIPSLSVTGMGVTRKFANVIEAKTIEILFNTNSLTDVGCTYKLFTRNAINKLSKLWTKTSALFNTELILLTVEQKIPFVEIPIKYLKRVGKSQIVGNWPNVVKWAFRIQFYIFNRWARKIFIFFKNKISK